MPGRRRPGRMRGPEQDSARRHSRTAPVTAAPGIDWAKWRPWLVAIAAALLTALLVETLRDLLRQVHCADVVRAIAAQLPGNLAAAGAATGISYLVLSGYDASALQFAGVGVRWTTILLTSFIAYALGNTVGLG